MNAPARKAITPDLLFPNMYLKAEDLAGKTATVTVADIQLEKPQRSSGKKAKKAPREFDGAMFFKGPDGKPKKKRMLLNATNMWAALLLLAPPGVRDINCIIGKRITIGADMDINLADGGLSLALRIIGSPDAAPDRVRAFNAAWQGDRVRGELCGRLKLATQRIGAATTANVPAPEGMPPVDEAPAPKPEDDFDEQWGDDSAPSGTATVAVPTNAKPKPTDEEIAAKVKEYSAAFSSDETPRDLRVTTEKLYSEHDDVKFHPDIISAKDNASARVHGVG